MKYAKAKRTRQEDISTPLEYTFLFHSYINCIIWSFLHLQLNGDGEKCPCDPGS